MVPSAYFLMGILSEKEQSGDESQSRCAGGHCSTEHQALHRTGFSHWHPGILRRRLPTAGPAHLWNSSCAGTDSHPVAAAATSQCSNSSYHWAELGGSTSQSAEKRSWTRKERLGEWKELERRTKDISENSPRSRLSGTQCKSTGSCKSDPTNTIATGPAEHRVNLSLVFRRVLTETPAFSSEHVFSDNLCANMRGSQSGTEKTVSTQPGLKGTLKTYN